MISQYSDRARAPLVVRPMLPDHVKMANRYYIIHKATGVEFAVLYDVCYKMVNNLAAVTCRFLHLSLIHI